ncbi:hypothetical protein GCM10011504_05530 [Siccirubricoccus deserti]|nr:hypothetical protein GCM10011504_05530 [Siccirubricoccus deserti]
MALCRGKMFPLPPRREIDRSNAGMTMQAAACPRNGPRPARAPALERIMEGVIAPEQESTLPTTGYSGRCSDRNAIRDSQGDTFGGTPCSPDAFC